MGKTPDLVIFDLFDTILDKEWFDYDKVLEYLHDRYFARFTKEEVNDWALEFRKLRMMDRNKTHRESSFTDQLAYYEKKSGVNYPDDYKSIEWEIFHICREEKIGNHVVDILSHLKEKNHPLAILSNSIFSSGCLNRYLESFDLLSYFDKVYSSADLGIRKPSSVAFLRVCDEFGIAPENAWFVGNNKEKDVLGARNAGLKAVYYDRIGDGYDGYHVSDLIELKKIIE